MTDSITSDFYFAQIPEWVLYSEISAQAVRLYAVLHRYADKDGTAFPSRATLAKRLGMKSPKTVDAALIELQSIGAVTVEHRHDAAGDMTSNLYTVRFLPQQGVGNLDAGGREGNYTTGREGNYTTGREADYTGTIATTKQSQPNTYIEETRLANLLADLIAGDGTPRPKVTDAWVKEIDLMIRVDKIPVTHVEAAIKFSQADSFERKVILSPKSLRKGYLRLLKKAGVALRSRGDSAVDQFLAGRQSA